MDTTRKIMRERSADALQLFYDVTIEDVDGMDATLLTVPALADENRDAERWRDSYLYVPTQSDFRRITAYNATTQELTINREFATSLAAQPLSAQVYLMLSPTDWNKAINEFLTSIYKYVRYAVTIVDAQKEYTLDSQIQHKRMVVDVRYRDTVTGDEKPLPRFRLDESNNGVILHLLDSPWASTQFEIVVEAQRYYNALTQDATSTPAAGVDDVGITTCPDQLWRPGMTALGIHRLQNKYGEKVRKMYAQNLAIAERNFNIARATVLPSMIAREYNQDVDDAETDSTVEEFFRSANWA